MHNRQKRELLIFNVVQIILIVLIIGSGVGLLISQWILADNELRSGLQLKDWYGTEYGVDAAANDAGLWGNVVLGIEQYSTLPLLEVYINGNKAGHFDTERLVLKVYPGDIVAVDSTAYAGRIKVKMVSCSSSISTEELQEEMWLKKERKNLGTIVFK